MSTEKLFAREGQYSTTEIARRLRIIADALERGTIFLLDQEVRAPEQATFELELEAEPEDDTIAYELEIEISWSAPAPADAPPTED